ncbi:hypothetical protein L3V79_05265 [Thiotrichales bacterium 19S9-12]|nr:hypothetical protein [Thiotrichales bacterium 19S9-11]MCF6811768.1 hypothetical protein [Thiotrichales bacterium 19S9-12]
MKNRIRKIFLSLLLSVIVSLIAGCPAPITNRLNLDENAPLPYPPKKDKALVYIAQPMTVIDWVIVGGAVSDGNRYHESKIYIRSRDSQFAYVTKIDTLHRGACFYIDPGVYMIKFVNEIAKPRTLQDTYHFPVDSVRYLGLDLTSYSGGYNTELKLVQLNEKEGRGYIAKNNQHHKMSSCIDVTQQMLKEAHDVTIAIRATINNEMTSVLLGSSKSVNANIKDVKQLVIPAKESYQYTETYVINNREVQNFISSPSITFDISEDGKSVGLFPEAVDINFYLSFLDKTFSIYSKPNVAAARTGIDENKSDCSVKKTKNKIDIDCAIQVRKVDLSK